MGAPRGRCRRGQRLRERGLRAGVLLGRARARRRSPPKPHPPSADALAGVPLPVGERARADQARPRCRERRTHAAAELRPDPHCGVRPRRRERDDGGACSRVPRLLRRRRPDRRRAHPVAAIADVGCERTVPPRGGAPVDAHQRNGLAPVGHAGPRPRGGRRGTRHLECRARARCRVRPRSPQRAVRRDVVGELPDAQPGVPLRRRARRTHRRGAGLPRRRRPARQLLRAPHRDHGRGLPARAADHPRSRVRLIDERTPHR